jgi:hypothetical protein
MNKIQKAINRFHDPYAFLAGLGRNGLLNWMPDSLYLKIRYRDRTGRKLNLNNPVSFTEKIQWLKLYNRRPEYITYADKFAVRDYVASKIGGEYLVPLIGVYDSVKDIPWEELPQKFVLKCTHGSGTNIICKDKDSLDIEAAKKQLDKWMHTNWYWWGREWVYTKISPRIICEEFIRTTDGETPSDYKFMCFEGKVRLIQVHQFRHTDHHTKDTYTVDWKKTQISHAFAMSDSEMPKPRNLKKMIEVSEILARGNPFIRIDLYTPDDDTIYFGEITMYPTSGFSPFSDYHDDIMLGSWIHLPKKHAQ